MGSPVNKKTVLIKRQDIAGLICLIAAILFFIWRAPFGFGLEDESWYLTFPHRLLSGDSLVTDEWHLAQFIGFLLYLPVKAYVSLRGSTDGIIMFFRYLFILFQSAVSTALYLRLRQFGIFSILGALIFYLHLPYFTFMNLGYYSMGLGFAVLAGVLMATMKTRSRGVLYAAGLFFACAVINNPALSLVYMVYTIYMILCEITKNKKIRLLRLPDKSFTIRAWFWLTFGIFTMAAILLIFIFSRANIDELIKNIPMLFKDPEYQILSTGSGTQNVFSIKQFLTQIIKINPYLFAVSAILFTMLVFDKNRINHRRAYLAADSVIFFAYIVWIIVTVEFPNYACYMFPFALLGLTCYIVSETKNKDVFVFLWIFGVLYTFCLEITSLMGFFVSSMGMLLSNVASVIFIANIMKELCNTDNGKIIRQKHNNPIRKLLFKSVVPILAAAMLFQIGQEFYAAANLKFNPEYLVYDSKAMWGASRQKGSKLKLDVTLQDGPEKGIKTSAAYANVYNGIINDLDAIKAKNDGPVYIAALYPWCYLYLDMPYGAYSAWCLSYDANAETQRLSDYFRLHPDKAPKYIYIPKMLEVLYISSPERAKEMKDTLSEYFDYTSKESEYGFTLEVTGYHADGR